MMIPNKMAGIPGGPAPMGGSMPASALPKGKAPPPAVKKGGKKAGTKKGGRC